MLAFKEVVVGFPAGANCPGLDFWKNQMIETTPHFLLYCESVSQYNRGTWRFSLEQLNSTLKINATEAEENFFGDRLALLGVIRGLEALPEPGRVTLLTSSQYVSRGFRYGLPLWQENNFVWERFGRRVPVKNCDLWQRVDHAMQFHTIDCRPWKFETQVAPVDAGVENLKQHEENTLEKNSVGRKPAIMQLLKNKINHYGESMNELGRLIGVSTPNNVAS